MQNMEERKDNENETLHVRKRLRNAFGRPTTSINRTAILLLSTLEISPKETEIRRRGRKS